MRNAISETDRRRAIQVAYNEEHGITPATIVKGISDISDFLAIESKVPDGRAPAPPRGAEEHDAPRRSRRRWSSSRRRCSLAADELRFEYAAKLRDEIKELRRELERVQAEAS